MVISFERNYIQEVITNSSPMHKEVLKSQNVVLQLKALGLILFLQPLPKKKVYNTPPSLEISRNDTPPLGICLCDR